MKDAWLQYKLGNERICQLYMTYLFDDDREDLGLQPCTNGESRALSCQRIITTCCVCLVLSWNRLPSFCLLGCSAWRTYVNLWVQ